jgi:hypothetical protein
MVFSASLATKLALGLVNGPLAKILESHVADDALRLKLAAEMEQKVLSHLTRTAELGQSVVMAEVQSEHWLSRSWRPMLMLLLMGFLLLAGLILPLADVIAGAPIRFEPRWQMLPDGFWDFLAVGMGGYIGGRSLEKVAGAVTSAAVRKAPGRKGG